MKTLGLIGGTSWISTIDYYRIINQTINEELGGLNSAKIYLYSLNFEEFRPPPDIKDWDRVLSTLSEIAKKLEAAGAECIVLCANTPHLVADEIQSNITIPIIHISSETAKEIRNNGINKVGLLGTKFTMEQSFFKDKLKEMRIETIIPESEDREFIHDTILNELGKNIFSEATRNRYLKIIDKLTGHGAEAIIMGCTEIPLLIKDEDCSVPVYNTTMIHAKAAARFALEK